MRHTETYLKAPLAHRMHIHLYILFDPIIDRQWPELRFLVALRCLIGRSCIMYSTITLPEVPYTETAK